ncbi:hypothetical protein niasHT_032100 [Heterodera trifolii]|uniref:Uncharacterized protein n=1 Tax=Heterodera trifolii TaxID=157864 RepID=A0ABD2HNH4_9BILA
MAFSTASSRANFVIVICNWSNYDFVVPFDLTIYVEKCQQQQTFFADSFPISRDENQWTKWKKEAIKLELLGKWNTIHIGINAHLLDGTSDPSD